MGWFHKGIMIKPIHGVCVFVIAAALTACTTQYLAAATLANADRIDRKLTVIKGSSRDSQTVKAGALIKEFCPDGCIVRINKDPQRDFILEGRERVTIEDGLLYYDGELAAETQVQDKAASR